MLTVLAVIEESAFLVSSKFSLPPVMQLAECGIHL